MWYPPQDTTLRQAVNNILKYYPNGQDGDGTHDDKMGLGSGRKAYVFFRSFDENGKPVVTVTGIENSAFSTGQPVESYAPPSGPDGRGGKGAPPPQA